MTKAQKIQLMKDEGLELSKVTFHKTVASLVDGTPEYQFYHPTGTHKKSRRAHLWWHESGILIEQNSKAKVLPLADVADNELL